MKHLLYLVASVGLLLASCEKNALSIPADVVTSGARLKLINAAPDLPGGIELAINGKKFSANAPSGATATSPGFAVGLPFNSTYPGTGSNYAIVSPGSVSLSLTSPATTTVASATAIGATTATLDDNAYYSLFVVGAGAQPETVLLKDELAPLNPTTSFYVRFVNLIPGTTTYDVLLADGTTVVARQVAYKAASSFITVPAIGSQSFLLRATGSATNIGTTYAFNSANDGRVLTLFARGVTGRTGTAAPALNGYVNR
ncbi:hypothetical protein FAES_5061 [Fibrella aestuarina BUZ 2]|uniref:DUF4397 domain-containing protein n=1 Tax=Fibrella aestuarina BUZ 2 TaxID=1166018 RepID=I0KG07_9BACT|nr:DUF4397 domain-containing protein [Fibrella aestuarina]CCH03060.1 hypothetical protein FAES_5061 [Fibrella aestuarina BUZ 2]